MFSGDLTLEKLSKLKKWPQLILLEQAWNLNLGQSESQQLDLEKLLNKKVLKGDDNLIWSQKVDKIFIGAQFVF